MAKLEFLSSAEPVDQFADYRDIDPTTIQPEGFVTENAVHVDGTIAPHLLTGYEINPIVDHTVRSIGQVALKQVRQTISAGGRRKHRLYTIERSDYRHVAEITDPVAGGPDYLIVSLPGLTESIENPIRQAYHASLAEHNPAARVVSIGSNGIGIHGARYGWNERSSHGLEAMAEQRLSLAKAFGGDLPTILFGTSMGSVIAHRIVELNQFGQPADGSITLIGQYLLSSALVDPHKVPQDMALRFIPGMILDMTKEIGLKSSPADLIRTVKALGHYGLSLGDGTALANQVIELLHGTPEDRISAAFATTKTVIVNGETDCIAQWPMLRRLQTEQPDNLVLGMVAGRGHSLGLKPHKAVAKLARVGSGLFNTADGFAQQLAA